MPREASVWRAVSSKRTRFSAAHARASARLSAGQASSVRASTASRTASFALWSRTESVSARMWSRRVSAASWSAVVSWLCAQPAPSDSRRQNSSEAHSTPISRWDNIKNRPPLGKFIQRMGLFRGIYSV